MQRHQINPAVCFDGGVRRPSRDQILAAAGRRVPDVLTVGLRVVFCGINPSLYSAAVGHHFARPGNRFWPAIHRAGFTDRLLSPFEDHRLLEYGLGVTNIADRATATADLVRADELLAGARRLTRKLKKHRPAAVAFLGIGAYRAAFGKPKATLGEQPEKVVGCAVWVLPNPSGLNAHYQLADLAPLYAELRQSVH
jgi:double-stranded uracil-DNA glycosylase